jgi:hypothetical protein
VFAGVREKLAEPVGLQGLPWRHPHYSNTCRRPLTLAVPFSRSQLPALAPPFAGVLAFAVSSSMSVAGDEYGELLSAFGQIC